MVVNQIKMEMYRVVTSDTLVHEGIPKMKWGVRRYQNPDGTLTELGKQRLREKRHAAMNKDADKYDRTKISQQEYDERVKALNNKLSDPDKWVREDIDSAKRMADFGGKAIEAGKNIEKATRPEAPKVKRLDLRNMSDQELRAQIDREVLERRYNELFNAQPPARISKGRQRVQTALEVGGAVLGVTSTALGVALAIKQLKSQ